ncbi:MAG: MlaD family protein [Bacteroidales bacterium]|jgi:phospholipid/cholesterol/gamma-HCH transport system substrate-binding protein|nr:MlaD family protein [Bacteroidales bacterium]
MTQKNTLFKNKYNKDIAIGIVSILTVAFFIWFAFFLKGNNVFSKEDRFYAIYNTTGGIVASGPVFINGMKVGRVSKLDFVSETDRRIKMTINVLKEYPLPKGSIASLEANGLMGGKCIVIIPGDSPEEMNNGDEFITRSTPGLTDNLGKIVNSIDSLLANINAVVNDVAVRNLTESFASLNASLKNIAVITDDAKNLVSSEKSHIQNIVRNVESVTNTLKQNEQRLDNIIGNLSNLTDTIAKAQIAQTLNSLNASLKGLNDAISQINTGDGTAGKLIYDEHLYNNLERATANLNSLLKDLQENPGRYVHLSLFGAKDKKKKENKPNVAK